MKLRSSRVLSEGMRVYDDTHGVGIVHRVSLDDPDNAYARAHARPTRTRKKHSTPSTASSSIFTRWQRPSGSAPVTARAGGRQPVKPRYTAVVQ